MSLLIRVEHHHLHTSFSLCKGSTAEFSSIVFAQSFGATEAACAKTEANDKS